MNHRLLFFKYVLDFVIHILHITQNIATIQQLTLRLVSNDLPLQFLGRGLKLRLSSQVLYLSRGVLRIQDFTLALRSSCYFVLLNPRLVLSSFTLLLEVSVVVPDLGQLVLRELLRLWLYCRMWSVIKLVLTHCLKGLVLSQSICCFITSA